jgi:hypothetical protein
MTHTAGALVTHVAHRFTVALGGVRAPSARSSATAYESTLCSDKLPSFPCGTDAGDDCSLCGRDDSDADAPGSTEPVRGAAGRHGHSCWHARQEGNLDDQGESLEAAFLPPLAAHSPHIPIQGLRQPERQCGKAKQDGEPDKVRTDVGHDPAMIAPKQSVAPQAHRSLHVRP